MAPILDHDAFVEEVRARTGLDSPARAEVGVLAVLSVLRERLADDEAEALARGLPEPFAKRLLDGDYLWDFGVDVFYERVAARIGGELGLAREEAQVVCQVVAENTEAEALERVRRHLSEDFRDLLSPRETIAEPPQREAFGAAPEVPAPRDTLATGRPGSKHPISEADPATRGHTHSVARNPDPHAETKLSSARGLTQERLRESLADAARPSGPTHSLSES